MIVRAQNSTCSGPVGCLQSFTVQHVVIEEKVRAVGCDNKRYNICCKKDLKTKQRVPAPLSPVPYPEIFKQHLQRTEVALITSTNYKTYGSVGLREQSMKKVKFLIETSAGPNLINNSFVRLTWAFLVKR